MTRTPIVGVIQARMGSSRLPGKILAPVLDGIPLLKVIVERVRDTEVEWWLATTDSRSDDLTACWGRELGLNVFRGDEQDVLSRFASIARETGSEWVVRLTADNPFVNAEVVNALVKRAVADPVPPGRLCDLSRYYPLGYVPEIVRSELILELDDVLPPIDLRREHVTSGLQLTHSQQLEVQEWPRRGGWRWTVDEIRDLEMTRRAFALFGEHGLTTVYTEMVEVIDRFQIHSLNYGVVQRS